MIDTYNNCKYLHTFEIQANITYNYDEFFKKMIKQMKSNLIKRPTSINMIFKIKISFEKALKLKQIYEKDKSIA